MYDDIKLWQKCKIDVIRLSVVVHHPARTLHNEHASCLPSALNTGLCVENEVKMKCSKGLPLSVCVFGNDFLQLWFEMTKVERCYPYVPSSRTIVLD